MFDTRDLLGAMLGTGMGGRNPRMGGMLGGGGGMGGMPGGLGGMLGGGGMPGGLGGMLGGGGLGGGGLGGMLGGGGMGGMGRGGGMGGGLQGALIGMLGGVAMSALQRRMMQGATRSASADEQPEPGFGRRSAAPAASDYDARQGSDPTGASSMGGGEPPELDEGRAQLLVRVMIAAANADMRIDQEEHSRIMGKLEEAGANDAARQFVEDEMRRPMSIDDIAREANSPDLAAQAYAAALAAIDVDKAMERRFLQSLAQKLGLDAEIVAEIHDQLGHPRLAA
jgi:uncharacterized membrane protein YebE (DUF533 family)